eukprot:scaffold1506_cov302-Prasinococcus_capsulatus_cf.AAC.1
MIPAMGNIPLHTMAMPAPPPCPPRPASAAPRRGVSGGTYPARGVSFSPAPRRSRPSVEHRLRRAAHDERERRQGGWASMAPASARRGGATSLLSACCGPRTWQHTENGSPPLWPLWQACCLAKDRSTYWAGFSRLPSRQPFTKLVAARRKTATSESTINIHSQTSTTPSFKDAIYRCPHFPRQ